MFRTRLLLSLLFCFIQTIGIGSMGKQLTPKYLVCCILNAHPPKEQLKDQDIRQKNALSAAGGSRLTVSQAHFCCLLVSICLLLQDCSSCRRAKGACHQAAILLSRSQHAARRERSGREEADAQESKHTCTTQHTRTHTLHYPQ